MATKQKVVSTDSFESFWTISGTSAGVFVQATVATGFNPDNGYVGFIHDISFDMSQLPDVNGTGGKYIQVAVTRGSKTSMPTFADTDVIGKYSIMWPDIALGVAGKVGSIELPIEIPFEGKQIVAGQALYMQVLAQGFTSFPFAARVNYTTEAMPKAQILEILYG